MPSKQELTRIRVVTFYNNNADQAISYTVKHFMAEGMPRSSVYNIINTYKKRLTTKEKVGKGRYFQKMSRQKVQKLYRMMNHKDKFTLSGAAVSLCLNIEIRQTFLSVGQSKTFSVICVASFIGMVGAPKILIIS